MPPKGIVSAAVQADPMLQGTYLQDDAKDFIPSSVALDEFEDKIARGHPVHNSQTRRYVPQSTLVTKRQQQKQQQQQHQKHLIRLAPQHRLSGTGGGPCLSAAEQERLEEIEAVRHLGNDSDGDE